MFSFLLLKLVFYHFIANFVVLSDYQLKVWSLEYFKGTCFDKIFLMISILVNVSHINLKIDRHMYDFFYERVPENWRSPLKKIPNTPGVVFQNDCILFACFILYSILHKT